MINLRNLFYNISDKEILIGSLQLLYVIHSCTQKVFPNVGFAKRREALEQDKGILAET